MNTHRIDIVPASLDRFVQAVMSQRGSLRSGQCPAPLRQLRLRQVVVAGQVAGYLARAEQAGVPISLPRDYAEWLDVPSPKRWSAAL
jgi:hypothetical protein